LVRRADLVDYPDDIGNLARGLLDPRHGVDRLRHHLATPIGDIARAAGQLVGLQRVLGILLHGRGHLFHRGGALLEAGPLFGALRQIARAGGNLQRRSGHFASDRFGLRQGLGQLFGHPVGVVLEFAEHAAIVRRDPTRQIAARHRAHKVGEVGRRFSNVVAQPVHRGGEIKHKAALAFERNAAGEVPSSAALTMPSTSSSIALSMVSFLHSVTVPERLPSRGPRSRPA
jgi:hypothetical protein